MLKIRLQRVGRKHEPSFRLVLTDSKNSTKSGRYLEVLGSYDPRKTNEHFDSEKIKYWISKGAKPTDTVHNLLINHKIIEGKKINVLPRKRPIVKEAKDGETSSDQAPKETETKTEIPTEEKSPEPAVESAQEAPKEEVKSEESKLEEGPAPAPEA